MTFLSIDIGSTWTKGATFQKNARDDLSITSRVETPTTIDDLSDGFFKVLNKLRNDETISYDEYKLSYSSSAKGGLAVAAIGIVPDITSEMAKIAAFSAGAKITKVYSYYITQSDIEELETTQPDILLFAGGTDGGNEDYIRANALLIAKSNLYCPIIYAGNRSLADEILGLLHDKDVISIENILPQIHTPNPEPTRNAIRSIFLSKITKGKGLDKIIEKTGVEPLPTPYSVYEFSRYIQQYNNDWKEFILLDLGGATTDVYSVYDPSLQNGNVLRGLQEPHLKRTVEGDLGMRVSAVATLASSQEIISNSLKHNKTEYDKFTNHISSISQTPEVIPQDNTSKIYDNILAGACFINACKRHAGRTHQVYTADGAVTVQTGRDMTKIKRVIGSGGYLSKVESFDPNNWLSGNTIDHHGKRILIPSAVEYYRDEHYLIPMLANVAREEPEAAAKACIGYLSHSLH